MVEFRELNLIKSWESLPAAQLILMRNVLIYFDVAAKKTILEKVGQRFLAFGSVEGILLLDLLPR